MQNKYQLVYKIAQLETELCVARQQNLQAKSTIKYLLELLSSKACLPSTEVTSYSFGDSTLFNPSGYTRTEGDLLDFTEDEELREHRSLVGETNRSERDEQHILDDTPIDMQPAITIPPSGPRLASPVANRQGGTASRFATGARALDQSRRLLLQRPPVYAQSSSLLVPEYNRLMGAACFIEEMTEHEQREHWQEFALKYSPRRPAEEWATLYATEVRPVFLARMQARRVVDEPEDERVAIHERRDSVISVPESASPVSDSTLTAARKQVSMLAELEKLTSECVIGRSHSSGENSPPVEAATAEEFKFLNCDRDEEHSSSSNQLDREPKTMECKFTELPFTSDAQSLLFRASGTDSWPHRSMIISGIPTDMKLHTVLDHIWGSKIIRAEYFNTRGMKLKSGVLQTNMAMVVFADGRRAWEFVNACKGRLDVPHESGCCSLAIKLVQTATRIEMPEVRLEASMTRVLLLRNHTQRVTIATVLNAIGVYEPYLRPPRPPLRFHADAQGILTFEFASMTQAVTVAEMIAHERSDVFAGVQTWFGKDPCERFKPHTDASRV